MDDQTQAAPAEVTQIPVTVPEDTVEAPAEEPENSPEPAPPVEGSQETTPTAESLNTIVPEPAPNPVPATAAQATDAVTVNTNLHTLSDKLEDAVNFVNSSLPNHEIASQVIDDVLKLVKLVKNAII